MAKYITLHVIRNFNGCPNRDFTNTQKTTRYGGSERSLISSQCLNSAALDYRSDVLKMEKEGTTANVDVLVKEICSRRNLDFEVYSKLVSESVFGVSSKKNKGKKNTENDNGSNTNNESNEKAATSQTVKVNATSIEKVIDEIIKNDNKPINNVSVILEKYCIEANLTGIMSTGGRSIGSTTHRSFAVSTHAVAMEYDDFTCFDSFNKTKEDGSPAGAIHLDSMSRIQSTYYYSYTINCDEIMARMGDKCTTDTIKKILLSNILQTPVSKKNSMHSNEKPAFIVGIVSDNADTPTFLSAFEKPVKTLEDGFISPSINKLMDYITKYYKKFGSRFINNKNDTVVTFCFNESDYGYEKRPTDVETIDEFLDKLVD